MDEDDYRPQPVFINKNSKKETHLPSQEIFTPSFKENQQNSSHSLADAFWERKQKAIESGIRDHSQQKHFQDSEESKEKKFAGGRTKEQILAQRKEMMKPKTKVQERKEVPPPQTEKDKMMDWLAKGEK